MNVKIAPSALPNFVLLSLSWILLERPALGQEASDRPKWVFHAVRIDQDEGAATEKLNQMSQAGWEYVMGRGTGHLADPGRRRTANDHAAPGELAFPRQSRTAAG